MYVSPWVALAFEINKQTRTHLSTYEQTFVVRNNRTKKTYSNELLRVGVQLNKSYEMRWNCLSCFIDIKYCV